MTLEPAETAPPARTVDRFLDGRVTLVQPRTGHRAGLDAALLQALVPAEASGLAVDLGTGAGTIAFAVAARAPALSAVAVDRDPDILACAETALGLPENAAFAARVLLAQGDVENWRETLRTVGTAGGSADWVLMNPPFDAPGRVRQSPDAGRRSAHVSTSGALAGWCRTASALLRPGGTLGMIQRAAALPECLSALGTAFGEICILPVHPFVAAPARRVIVRARRASRAGLQIMPGLVLHQKGGAWTPEADAILRGRAELPLR